MKTRNGMSEIFQVPSAFAPILMSLAALVVVTVHVARFGAAIETDEGVAAHLWQLLMVGQLPMIAVFAIKRLRLVPREACVVLGLQFVAAATAAAPVFFLGL